MGVSKNSGTPKSSILIGFSIINHPFWGTPYFWTHPYGPGWVRFDTNGTVCRSAILQVLGYGKKPATSVWPCGEQITRNSVCGKDYDLPVFKIVQTPLNRLTQMLLMTLHLSRSQHLFLSTESTRPSLYVQPPLPACCWAGRIFAFVATIWTSKHEESILPDNAGACLYYVQIYTSYIFIMYRSINRIDILLLFFAAANQQTS